MKSLNHCTKNRSTLIRPSQIFTKTIINFQVIVLLLAINQSQKIFKGGRWRAEPRSFFSPFPTSILYLPHPLPFQTFGWRVKKKDSDTHAWLFDGKEFRNSPYPWDCSSEINSFLEIPHPRRQKGVGGP
ncbi:hypothetical protein TNCV_1767911 [Trichonephila clavipes]|nr:hypothetical protein TNCV_1767911 [Trichonephila clavipes]